MDRRAFLKRTFVATAATGGAAAFAATRSNDALVAPTHELFVLDEIGFGVLVAYAQSILPFEGVEPTQVAHDIDAALRFVSPESQADTNLVLAILENSLSGLLTRGSLTLFSELSPQGREAALGRWGHSPVGMLRAAQNSLRKLCLGTFYARPDKAKEIDYPGPPFTPPAPPPIEARAALSPAYVPKPKVAPPPEAEVPVDETAEVTP